MIVNKISPEIIKNVSILSNSPNSTTPLLVEAENFSLTKQFLDKYGYHYKPYRFANCFCVYMDNQDLDIISCQNFVKYIHSNPIVMTTALKDYPIYLDNLTLGKFLGQNQTICFIDTGLYPHFDFLFPQNRVLKFIDFTKGGNIPYDDNGHGTFVAGIACGCGIYSLDKSGIAPKANIISLKALSNIGNSTSNVILDAMQWVYENHKVYNISVVCMSFGADVINENDPLSRGAEALWKRGIIVVAAAGNSGPNERTIKSPGNNPYIITVGALDTSNMQIADFSSRGPTIYGHKPDLIAPAVDITSCSNSNIPYTNMSGTSVATPIVAGICADIKSRWPKMTNNEIKSFLLKNCSPITGNKDIEGAGYLNFKNFENNNL